MRKVIKFFNERNSTINFGVIDLKKAFDKVNIYGLLGILQERKTNVKIINVLENGLAKCHSSTRWLSSNSQSLPLCSGVRQGGILSPLLFNLFVDVVLKKLEESKLGCFIKLNCYNSFMYADDLILLSISISDLQSMLNLCASVFNEIDLPINTNKSHCIRIGPRCNYQCCELSTRCFHSLGKQYKIPDDVTIANSYHVSMLLVRS